ncbi:ubiquitin-conjugating enzyme E2 Q2 [Massarina eburnea CBS 473.64]|uniref:Ubiquitin-conjugating enzyme E2 Q2 n=1 Tax=Massarina eburnea CBS 473.64 TaxID=1395130 RepID=A0A6A6S495_9PLEO|nr:ubiquitin-conjugating enzyme E2 Q2 [Massarina eburnea CBS 473.64]
MPRRQFIADLQRVSDASVSIAGISNVRPGDNDGDIQITCAVDGEPHELSILIPEVSDYPSDHDCMVFGVDSLPKHVADVLDAIAAECHGKSLTQILEALSRRLGMSDKDGDEQMMDSQDVDSDFEEEDDDDEEPDFFPDYDDHASGQYHAHTTSSMLGAGVMPTANFRQRIRSDLLTAKAKGFKVGYVGGLMDGCGAFVSISCRFSKLGISEEAMEAWQVQPSEYLILILSYPNGYKTMEAVTGYDSPLVAANFGMRVGVSSTYKATLQEAVRAFTVLSKDDEKRRERDSQSQAESQTTTTPHRGFRDTFISRPLNGLLKEKFPQLLRYRYNGMTWGGAEVFYMDHMATKSRADLGLADKYMVPDSLGTAQSWPAIVVADHILESTPNQEHSLPLVAMQFVLRHFVRCTEFCLVCFSKMPYELQAIKPYVCDNPLCLYQYMSLGFGPSIEHEIMSQPKVVDLLISFCYASACSNKLKDFPIGLSLSVPPSEAYGGLYNRLSQPGYTMMGNQPAQPAPAHVDGAGSPVKHMKYNAVTGEMLFPDKNVECPVRAGNWIVIRNVDDRGIAYHCRVVETLYFPTVKVAKPVVPAVTPSTDMPRQLSMKQQMESTRPVPTAITPVNEFRPATFHTYDQNFDALDEHNKREAICALLDLLPSVAEMSQYLRQKTQSPLSSWVDRLSPAALGVLRWIIASNRACIMQVADAEQEAASGRKGQDRLCGMPGWSQFRFAMGAPDKERRFLHAVRETTTRLRLSHSTLFAWHGSPLHNWHGIIREGLHFKDTAHGRAYGDGVYHSLESQTSLGYSSFYSTNVAVWSRSELKISQALALNEIVNAPNEFQSKTPHLVVAQLDWIQTRYLLVKTGDVNYDPRDSSADSNLPQETKPFDPIEQDKYYTPRGVGGPLVIPQAAISHSRRPKSKKISNDTQNKRQKASGSVFDPIEVDDDDNISIATLAEDLTIYDDGVYASAPLADNAGVITPNSDKGKASIKTGFFSKLMKKSSSLTPVTPLTDYKPGTLDYNTLPMLAQPTWASLQATKRLMRDFQDIIKVQNSQPLHELGWHIDEDKIDNMYQWIVELHSFDPKLPLAQDMKKKDYKSIVMELRFGKDYPMSPPFVRVIRPRFLGFRQGGGGHVTVGGAMCMQLLTNDGWSAVSSIESVLLQVRVAITSTDPNPARLVMHGRQDYGVGEAVEAYMRACQIHGWTVPAGFKEMAYGGVDPSSASAYDSPY